MIGSIIDWMGNEKSTVWGSGILNKISSGESTKKLSYRINNVHAVRGCYTRNRLLEAGVACPEVYGDPALLMPLIYKSQVKKVKDRIGFIPHYVDMKDENIKRLMRECGDNAYLIKVKNYGRWQEVIDQICSCEFIISSSLHGLILSDSYGIPNQWIILPKGLPGGSFKFDDYYSSVGKKPVAFEVTNNTSITDLLKMKEMYQKIKFDPRPLLNASPFEIKNPKIEKFMEVV